MAGVRTAKPSRALSRVKSSNKYKNVSSYRYILSVQYETSKSKIISIWVNLEYLRLTKIYDKPYILYELFIVNKDIYQIDYKYYQKEINTIDKKLQKIKK